MAIIDGRIFELVAANQANKIAVVDAKDGKVAAIVQTSKAPHPGRRAGWVNPEFGPVWGTSHLGEGSLVAIGADPEGHPDLAWKVGFSLNPDEKVRRSVCVIAKADPTKPAKCCEVVDYGRATHFEYNAVPASDRAVARRASGRRRAAVAGAIPGTSLSSGCRLHPRSHFWLTALAAGVASRRLGKCALVFWAGGVVADSDHWLWHTRHTGRLDMTAAWTHFAGNGQGERPASRLPLHQWRIILVGLALGPLLPWVGTLAAGLAFHRLLDDLADWLGPWWRARAVRRRRALHQAVFRRAGYRCEVCGARGVKLEAHHRVQRAAGGQDTVENLVALCVPCHRAVHRAVGLPV